MNSTRKTKKISDKNKKISDKNKKIFDKLKKSNNGVFYYDNTKKLKKGGDYILSKDCSTLDIFSKYCEDIEQYKNNISKILSEKSSDFYIDFIKIKNAYSSYYNFDNYFMHNYVLGSDNRDTSSIISDELKNAFKTEYKYVENIKKLYCNDHHKYKIADLENEVRITDNKELILDFSHSTYNKDIVTAYQHDFIENFDNLEGFIKMQHDFINELSLSEKIIINDYTKKSAFDFYKKAYGEAITFNNKADGSYATIIDGTPVIELYNNSEDNEIHKYYFGDSYYKQIFDVIGPNVFTHIIKSQGEEYKNAFDKYDSKFHDAGDRGAFINIDDYWDFIKAAKFERQDPNSQNIFTTRLTPAEWQCVLIIFARDINNILLKSPRFNKQINCYRGTVRDYAILETEDKNEIKVSDNERDFLFKEGTYTSIRPGSFSFDFNKAKKYSRSSDGKFNNIYRITIQAGAPVLYIPSLSYASDEFEILHGGYGQFSHRGKVELSYNNINNKWGILSNKDEAFKSIDFIFEGYNIGTELRSNNTTAIVKNLITRIDEEIGRVSNLALSRQRSDAINYADCLDNRQCGGGTKKKTIKKKK
jgi:hypothetical protein